ncbi:hypothetical protein CRG98_014853 [Punica granatum]|uniref:Beta-glucosidase 46-like n=1 Tax=Punica granatum TaxID=22663 RepID=A0A2I0K854_PUNGR|nr:hypothetical protein CRG98_014853 [Punica granatum]
MIVSVDKYINEDIGLMVGLGVNSYRFSISWARILPKGRFGGINMDGIDYYNKLIDALLSRGIQPFVTLNHFDIPQELEDRYGGWLSPLSRLDFRYFADICFKYFGDRVKHWITFNEPNLLTILGYRKGEFPPSRCSSQFGNCTTGDSDKEPFIVAHNLILSHAAAAYTYRKKYQKAQKGTIGIVLHAAWFEPISDSVEDKLASERALSFFMNWFLDPIIFGRYPREMVEILGNTLPQFSGKQLEKLRRSGLDFIGVNHYTSHYVQDCLFSDCNEPGKGATWSEGYYWQTSIGQTTNLPWLNIFPEGMEKMVNYIKERYNNTPIYITENGLGELEDPKLRKDVSLQDVKRVEYMEGHLNSLIKAVRNGADVRGYFAWSLLDNFEWNFGYTVRFGLHHVDYKTMMRTPRLSASWYREFITKHKKMHMVTSSDNLEKSWY